jgi:hypothetical protein
MAYKKKSHLNRTSITNGYTDLYNPPFTPDFTKTNTFTITQRFVRRPDLLAYELYEEAAYWWVFALYNRNQILDPINDFKLGTTILVPTRNFITGI